MVCTIEVKISFLSGLDFLAKDELPVLLRLHMVVESSISD